MVDSAATGGAAVLLARSCLVPAVCSTIDQPCFPCPPSPRLLCWQRSWNTWCCGCVCSVPGQQQQQQLNTVCVCAFAGCVGLVVRAASKQASKQQPPQCPSHCPSWHTSWQQLRGSSAPTNARACVRPSAQVLRGAQGRLPAAGGQQAGGRQGLRQAQPDVQEAEDGHAGGHRPEVPQLTGVRAGWAQLLGARASRPLCSCMHGSCADQQRRAGRLQDGTPTPVAVLVLVTAAPCTCWALVRAAFPPPSNTND